LGSEADGTAKIFNMGELILKTMGVALTRASESQNDGSP